MPLVLYALAFAVSLAGQRTDQADSVPLHNLLLISADAQTVVRVEDRYGYGMPLAEFSKGFTAERFSLSKWGSRGMILIDRRLPLLVEKESQRNLVLSLSESVGPDLVVRVTDVPESKRQRFVESLEDLFPWHSRSEGFDMKKAAVGVDLSLNVVLHDAGGNQKKVALPMLPALARRRNAVLEDHPMPQRNRELSQEERGRLTRETTARTSQLERMTIHTFGTARKYLPDGLRASADTLELLLSELDTRTKEAVEGLIDKVGLHPSLRDLPGGKVHLDELPEELRDRLMNQVKSDWEYLGFSSALDAERYLRDSSSVELSMNIGLRRTFSASDKRTGRPSSGMVHNFLVIRP